MPGRRGRPWISRSTRRCRSFWMRRGGCSTRTVAEAATKTTEKPPRPQIDGILVVAKEPGPTSHDIVALIRRLTGVKRVGHGGTLDPFAAGVLPVFVGHATRLVEYHLT